MASLAGIALQMGYKVTGQDKQYYDPMKSLLNELGINEEISVEASKNLIQSDLVIIGNAISRGNPAAEYILNNRLKYSSGPAWLSKNVLKDKKVIVIAGTHGKTTTSFMVQQILQDNGHDPGYLIGGISNNTNKSFRYSHSEYFIIEGDEYDTAFFDKRSKFIHYKPHILGITNIEYDHSDIFQNLDDIYKQFQNLFRVMPTNSIVLSHHINTNIKKLTKSQFWSKTKFLEKEDLQISNLLGKHNNENATLAINIASQLNIDKKESTKSLQKFLGVKRRLEIIYNKDIIVYDDFAHHPTEIKASVETINKLYNKNKIHYILQIGSNTMISGEHKDALINIFSETENLYLYTPDQTDWLPNNYLSISYSSLKDLTRDLFEEVNKEDVVVFMSNKNSEEFINLVYDYG